MFFCEMLRRGWLYATVRRRSVLCHVQVRFSHRLEYFHNNFMAKWIKVPAQINPNSGDLVQQEHPKIRVQLLQPPPAHHTPSIRLHYMCQHKT